VSSLLKSNLAVASGTATSRLTGLLRVMAFGYVLGKSSLTDAYNQANASPNLIYELVLGGVLSSTLVPLFTRLAHDRDEDGEVAVRSVAIVLLSALTVVAVIASPLIFRLYATGTSATVDRDLYLEVGSTLTAFFLVQIFFYGLNALAAAELQARGRFFMAAWAPALSNVVVIITLLMVPSITDDQAPELGDVITNSSLRLTLGLGATVGIAVMALTLIPPLVRAQVPLAFRPNFRHPAVAQLRQLSGWAIGYVVANQLAILVVQNLLVRSAEGDQTSYFYAFTFFMLPHGLLAMSIATTFLPEMTRAIAQRDRPRLIDRSVLGIRLVALFTIPAGFGLFALRRPIIGLALQHGEFTADDALFASRALAGFALGLGAFSVYLFTLRVFYAHGDARTPFVINLVENLVNVVLAWVLYDRFGVLGIAASFAIAYGVAALWALQVVSYKVTGFPLRPLLGGLYRMLLASAVMAEAVWAVSRLVGDNDGIGALTRVAVAGLAGVAVYIGILLLLGAPEIDELRRRLRPAAAVAEAH
jgi:putative peptidoglycan lipid II flippase